MTKTDAGNTKLLDDADQATAEVVRLSKEAIVKPNDKALHQQMWDAMQRLGAAVRAVVKYTGGRTQIKAPPKRGGWFTPLAPSAL